ncbi:MAG: fatty acid desaturase [Myxococcota bacterium]
MHLAALGVFFVGFSWQAVLLCVAMYYLRMFGITGGYHRYFAHRSFQTGRVFQFLLAFLATTSAQKGVLWWAGHHRHHHKHSDQESDLHSPVRHGFWWSHMGWLLSPQYDRAPLEKIQDFARFPELRFLDKHWWLPPTLMAVTLLLVGGTPALFWGFFLSTVFLWHGTFTINSLSHVFGSRRYATTDTSKNNFFLALLTMGEGWHNNHHHYQSSCPQGFFWWEVDFTYYVIRALHAVGLVWEVRLPPKRVLDEGRGHVVEPRPEPAVATVPPQPALSRS